MEDNAFKKLQEIRDKVCYMKYNFQGNKFYHGLIFETLQGMIVLANDLSSSEYDDPIFESDDPRKHLLVNVITDILDHNGLINDDIIENVFSLICEKFDNRDYIYNPQEFFSVLTKTLNRSYNNILNDSQNVVNVPVIFNQNMPAVPNYSMDNSYLNFPNFNTEKISNSLIKSNDKSINNFNTLYNQNYQLSYVKQNLYQNIVNDMDRKITAHNLTIMLLQSRGLNVWKDQNNKLWHNRKSFGEKQKITITDLKDICREILGFYINIYANSDEVLVIDANYLIISLLKTVRKDVFNPFSNLEFIPIGNNLCDRNTFQYTKYLHKRQEPRIKYISYEKSFIEKLIDEMFIVQEHSQFMTSWYSKYMNDPVKSNIAVILIGDSETTDILVNNIFRPIFAKRKEYICVINDELLSKESNDENLLNNKILYHIDNLGSKADKRRVKKLVRTITKPNFITPFDAWDSDELYIHGNLLITSNKDTPYPYIQDIFSQCVVFRVKDLKTIERKLNIDVSQLDQMIENDLDLFSTKLLEQYYTNHLKVITTAEKLYLETMKNGVIVTPEIDCKIDKYISDIRNKRIEAFDAIKVYDEKMYEEFLTNISEDMIVQPLQSTYFNIINGEELIPHNGDFLELLRNKADMFKETPDDKSKVNGKKRYTIF